MTGQGWSLRRRVTRAIVGVLVLLMVLIVGVIYFINDAKRTGDELVDQWDPAYQISQNTLTAMVNQETGVRGYALGQDEAFLEPYNIAQLLGGSAQSTLRKYLLGYPDLLAQLRVLNAAIDEWRTNGRGAGHRPGPGRRPHRGEVAGSRRGTGGVRPDPRRVQRSSPTASTRSGIEVSDDRERAFLWCGW